MKREKNLPKFAFVNETGKDLVFCIANESSESFAERFGGKNTIALTEY